MNVAPIIVQETSVGCKVSWHLLNGIMFMCSLTGNISDYRPLTQFSLCCCSSWGDTVTTLITTLGSFIYDSLLDCQENSALCNFITTYLVHEHAELGKEGMDWEEMQKLYNSHKFHLGGKRRKLKFFEFERPHFLQVRAILD